MEEAMVFGKPTWDLLERSCWYPDSTIMGGVIMWCEFLSSLSNCHPCTIKHYWEWATVDKVLKGFARSYQFSLYVQICLHLWQILYTLFPIRGTQRILASHKQESLQYLWRKKVSCCEFDNCLFLVLFHHFQNHSLPAVIVKRSKI